MYILPSENRTGRVRKEPRGYGSPQQIAAVAKFSRAHAFQQLARLRIDRRDPLPGHHQPGYSCPSGSCLHRPGCSGSDSRPGTHEIFRHGLGAVDCLLDLLRHDARCGRQLAGRHQCGLALCDRAPDLRSPFRRGDPLFLSPGSAAGPAGIVAQEPAGCQRRVVLYAPFRRADHRRLGLLAHHG